jgi:hypothetical protein
MTDITVKIPVSDTASEAWTKVSGSKGSFWAAFALLFLVGVGFAILGMIADAIVSGGHNVVLFIGQVVNFLLQTGLLYIAIRCAQGAPFSYKNMFYVLQSNILIRIIGVYLLKLLIMMPFFLLIFLTFMLALLGKFIMACGILIVFFGMLYVSVRIILASAFVLDKGVNSWQAIVLSWKATRSNFWRLILLFFIQGVAFILGVITLLIGLIWALPFGFILYGVIYQKLAPSVLKA